MLPFNGMTTGTSNAVTFSEIVFSLRMTLPVVVAAVGFALIMGLFGGIAAAWLAARRDIVAELCDWQPARTGGGPDPAGRTEVGAGLTRERDATVTEYDIRHKLR